MKQLLIATNNDHKIEEIKAILEDRPFEVELLSPKELGIDIEIEESGNSYLENALIKARDFAKASGLPVLADDSGLEVDLLDGQPGIHSHRFLPDPNASSHERCIHLLSCLAGKPKPWKAHFTSVAVLYAPGFLSDDRKEDYFYNQGQIFGEITDTIRGEHGFGYDPIFWIPEFQKTMAELDTKTKNQISHRALAIGKFTELTKWIIY